MRNSPSGYLRRLVDVLMTTNALQRPALARRLNLPRQDVSDLLAKLESRGFVNVRGAQDGVPGRSQLAYSLRVDAALAMGFDVGGTKIAAALCDMRGKILQEHTEETQRGGAEEFVAQLAAIADRLCQRAELPRYQVRNTSIGVPAVVDPATGCLSFAGNLPGLEGIALRETLTKVLGGEVQLDNDVNLALVAETAHGKTEASGNVAFVALGTGIGAALMVDGHHLRGAFGGAGEIGYLPLWQLEPAGTATMENQIGEAGIRRAYVEAGGAADASVRTIFDAAAKGETAAVQTLDRTAEAVARGVVSILALVDVDQVIFGGSIGAREEFIDRVRTLVSSAWIRSIAIRRSDAGSRAGLLGSVETARQRLLNDLFGAS